MAAKKKAAEPDTGRTAAAAASYPNLNPQILESAEAVQRLLLSPGLVRRSGAGGAYQAVAQSTAIAIQDATSYLRSMATVNVAAVSVATALLVETGAPRYEEIIREMEVRMREALSYYREVGETAVHVLNNMPSE